MGGPVPSVEKAIFPNPLPAKGLFLPTPVRRNPAEIPNPSAFGAGPAEVLERLLDNERCRAA